MCISDLFLVCDRKEGEWKTGRRSGLLIHLVVQVGRELLGFGGGGGKCGSKSERGNQMSCQTKVSQDNNHNNNNNNNREKEKKKKGKKAIGMVYRVP